MKVILLFIKLLDFLKLGLKFAILVIFLHIFRF